MVYKKFIPLQAVLQHYFGIDLLGSPIMKRLESSPRWPGIARELLNQLGSQFGLHPVQIAHWRRTALDHLEELFVDGRTRRGEAADGEAERDALFEEIGRLKVELDFVKKKAGMLE